MHRNDQRGFTLIELLIVIVVIGILAAIAVPRLNVTREKAYKASMMSDLKSMAHAQEVYHNTYYQYATSIATLEAQQSAGVTLTINESSNTGWSATAVHQGVTGGQCGVYHGSADPAGGSPASVPGVVTCDF